MFFLIGLMKKSQNGTLKMFAESLDRGAIAPKGSIPWEIGPFLHCNVVVGHVFYPFKF
jgi:hypothetical protein